MSRKRKQKKPHITCDYATGPAITALYLVPLQVAVNRQGQLTKEPDWGQAVQLDTSTVITFKPDP